MNMEIFNKILILSSTIDSVSITTYSVTDDWPAVGSAKLLLNTDSF
jgi:hypothetical protein